MSHLPDFEVRAFNTTTFSDERHRPSTEVPAGAFVSVTLTSHDGDHQWGEFMQRDEALALYGWLGLLLSSPEPKREGVLYGVRAGSEGAKP